MFNSYLVTGLVAGLAASIVWIIVNLLVDAAFLPVLRRHSDRLNEKVMLKPALMLFALITNLALWGGLFGLGYGLVYPGLQSWGPLISGVVWGMTLFVPYSRGAVESVLFTKVPAELNVFRVVEGFLGLVAWGGALGIVFDRLI